MDRATFRYAAPRAVTDINDCYFYHTIALPTHGVMPGEWDLRDRVDDYLGGIALAGKRVLEVGSANGFLCFEMEKRGAEVVAFDLSEHDDWDIVPYGGEAPAAQLAERRRHIRRINNAWWLTHRLLRSQARVVYGNAYQVPEEIGTVQIATFGCILLHLRDPFLALQRSARLVSETLVVTDVMPAAAAAPRGLLHRLLGRRPAAAVVHPMPAQIFLPEPDSKQPTETWWQLPPDLMVRFVKVLGFPTVTVSFHRQRHRLGEMELYTVIGRRA